MDHKFIASTLVELTGTLKSTTKKEQKALKDLRSSLAKAIILEPESPIRETVFQHERIDNIAGMVIEETPLFKEMKGVTVEIESKIKGGEGLQHRVFRRTSPVINPNMPGARPSWGMGAEIDFTLGPFIDEKGLNYWFDFYIFTKTVGVYFGNETSPSVLLPVELTLLSGAQNKYNIGKGSIWIRSQLFAPTAPAGHYTGLRIKDGQLNLSQNKAVNDEKLKLSSGASISLQLDLEQPKKAKNSQDDCAQDAKNGDVKLPTSCTISISQNVLELKKFSRAKWKIFEDERSFAFDKQKNITYSTLLNHILIPCDTKPADFQIKKGEAKAKLCQVEGKAKVAAGYWTLPTTAINIAAPPVAAGNGSLAIQCKKGLQTRWSGLEGGDVALRKCFVQASPGAILFTSAKAGNIYARQQYELWQNETTGFPSVAKLQYTESFPFRFFQVNTGIETILTQADTDIQTDRPVKVNCSPFEIKGKDTLFTLYKSKAISGILLYDPNIIVDNSKSGKLQNNLKSFAIALNNALLTVTEPSAFLIAGELDSDTKLKKGVLNLVHGLFYLIPTLPDPYTANLALLLGRRGRDSSAKGSRGVQQIIALLLCTVSWPSKAEDSNADVSYQFLPYGAAQRSNTGLIQGNDITLDQEAVATKTLTSNDAQPIAFAVSDNSYNRYEYETPWLNLMANMGRDIFSLLDVSTNADLMGVTYGFLNEKFLLKVTHSPDGRSPELSKAAPVPYQIEGLDFKASGKFVKAFTVPQISWEPAINISPDKITYDPPLGFLGFPGDGGPTKIFNDSVKTVTLAPIPMSNFLVKEFEEDDQLNTYSIFTLPFGMQAIAKLDKENQFDPNDEGASIEFNRPQFEDEIEGGIQFKATGAYNHNEENRIFKGNAIQLTNLISSKNYPTTILGESVTEIFNREFSPGPQNDFFKKRGVPVERVDWSGYGSNMFSKWVNDNAAFAATSQAKFDVWGGRTAHEIIQVRSVIYPWGIYVVRTITLFRVNSAYVYRHDSGWKAETNGIYDFNYQVEQGNIPAALQASFESFVADYDAGQSVKNLRPYEVHPGMVKGVYNVQNIEETLDYPAYINDRSKFAGEPGLNADDDVIATAGGDPWEIKLTPVYFTANVAIDNVKEGATDGKVPCKKMLGFVQIGPRGVPIPRDAFKDLLEKYPDIGGDIDCLVDIGDSGQKMRVHRVEVNPSSNTNHQDIFAGVAKGTPILPPDGSWAVVQQSEQTGEVTPISDDRGVPLIQIGEWIRSATGQWSADQLGNAIRIANARELLKAADNGTTHFGFLQNTGSQKALFRLPRFEEGKNLLLSEKPDFADAYHLLNSKGIFPNLQDITDTLDLDAQDIAVKVLEEGFQMIEKGTEALENSAKKALEQVLPEGPWYWVGTKDGDEPVKIYVEYKTPSASSLINFDLDSQAQNWKSAMSDTAIVVDLGPFERLFIIKGNFDSGKGSPVSINQPVMEFGPDLKPVYDVLVLLATISEFPAIDYAELLQKGLEIAMSNSPEVWEYKFSAKKEIPVLRFPPPSLDSPTSPLRIEASLAVGAYFNESLSLTTDLDQLIPSAGAFVEFYGQMSVMCVSVAAATVYAVGQTQVKLYADLKDGPGIAMRYGFGVELAVGLPVIGTVSLTYVVGIDMDLNDQVLRVDAFLMFKGRAEILGGIVTVTIMIEARGGIERKQLPGGGEQTDMRAQVTFGLDISIFWVINLSFEESWEEQRQIA